MNLQTKILVGALTLLFLVIGVGLVTMPATKVEQNLGAVEFNYLNRPTNASSTVTTSSSLIVATSTGRQYLAIVNDGTTDVYLGVGVAAVSGKGIRLNAGGGSFVMDTNALFTDAVYGISSATANVTVIYK